MEQNVLKTHKYSYQEIQEIPVSRGIYAAWLLNECIYIGKSGKLFDRIKSHYSGQRGSDQFCLYIYDSYIKVSLNGKGAELTKEINSITKEWSRKNLFFSYYECKNDGEQELIFRKSMQPTLNPL